MKKIIFFTLLLLPPITNAKYVWQVCKNRNDIYACPESCKSPRDDVEVDFKINIDDKTVIRQAFVKSKLKDSYSLSNCKIADKENWECGDGDVSFGYLTTRDKEGMNNNIWYSYFEEIDTRTGKTYQDSIHYNCGKYRLFK